MEIGFGVLWVFLKIVRSKVSRFYSRDRMGIVLREIIIIGVKMLVNMEVFFIFRGG